jgi:hypothetical protein
MRALRLTVPLGAGETPASYASRLAARNGLTAREFCHDWGIRFQAVVDGDPAAVETISVLGGVDRSTLMDNSFIRIGKRNFSLRGERLMHYMLRRTRLHVCPACLCDDVRSHPELAPHIAVQCRAAWLIDAIKTCPLHNLGLMQIAEALPQDSIHDWALNIEPAVARLDGFVERASARPPSSLENYVLARLGGARSTPLPDSLELHAAIRTCNVIGAVELFGRKVSLRNLSDFEWWCAGAAGFQIVRKGAEGVRSLLDLLQSTYPYKRTGRDGPQATFGRIYQWLEFRAKSRAYDPVRAIVGQHIRDNQPIAPGDFVFGSLVVERSIHSVNSLSKDSKIHPKRLRKLLYAAGIISDDQMTLNDNLTLFDAKQAESVIRPAAGAISLGAAGQHLNAPRSQIELLAENRFIKPCMPVSGSAKIRYAIGDLDHFLEKLLEKASPVRTVKFPQATIPRAAKFACCSAATVVQLILSKKLSWVGADTASRGYLSVLVDSDEVRRKTRGDSHGGLTMQETSAVINSRPEVVSALVGEGHLATFMAKGMVNHNLHRFIKPSEAARFRKEFISLFELARKKRQSMKAVKNRLEAKGIRPEFDATKIGVTFYRR